MGDIKNPRMLHCTVGSASVWSKPKSSWFSLRTAMDERFSLDLDPVEVSSALCSSPEMDVSLGISSVEGADLSFRGLLTEPMVGATADWLSWRMVMLSPPAVPLEGKFTPASEKISNGCDSFARCSFSSFSLSREKKESTVCQLNKSGVHEHMHWHPNPD